MARKKKLNTKFLLVVVCGIGLLGLGVGDSGRYDNMRQYAAKSRNNGPDNKQAKAALPLSVVRAWMFGVQTEPQKVREAQSALAELEKSDPQNPELPSARASVVMKLAKA